MSAERECTPNFKTGQDYCGCGCGAFGTLKSPRPDGSRCVARKCKCPRCRGRNNNKRGHERQSKAFRRAGYVGKFSPRDEEAAGWVLRLEHKDGGKAQTVITAYERERQQSEAARPIGDPRPFVASYSRDEKHTYYVLRDDDLELVVAALAGSWGFTG